MKVILKKKRKKTNWIYSLAIYNFIVDGTITLTDFLNDTDSFKTKLVYYGLNDDTSTALLNSQIKILEIYKELKFTDKLKEKDLCDPLELVKYLVSNNTNVYLKPSENELLSKNVSLVNKDDLEISSVICGLSKRKVLSDADFLFKEINMDIIANYVCLY